MLDMFKKPPAQYRLAPFWVWGEMPELQEVERQVREMHVQGLGGFFIDGRLAGRTEGSGEGLLQCTQRACEAAERLGLHVYQYDEPTTPSGLPATLDVKLRTSATHADGRIRTLAKSPSSRGNALSMQDMKRAVDRLACLGANFFCPDAFRYSLAGLGHDDAMSQFYQSSFWPHYRHFADYAARLSYVMSQGKHRPQAALLRPGAYSDPMDRDTAEWLAAYCELLLAEHVDFDIIDEGCLAQATCADERLMVAEDEYELLILPPMAATAFDSARKIKAFADDCGKVIATMRLPAEDSQGDRHAEVRAAFEEIFEDSSRVFLLEIGKPADLPSALNRTLRLAIKREVSVRLGSGECADIAYTHRSVGGVEVFFLANQADEPREVRISIRCNGAPHLLNLESGDSTALPHCTQTGDRTVLLHRFEPHGSLLVAFTNEPAFAVAPPMVEEGQEIALADEWEFALDQPNCLTLRDWTFNTLIQQNHELYEYTTSFESDFEPQSLSLVLEQTAGFGADSGLKVFINDHEAPASDGWITDISLKTIDITALATKGTNTVRMLVERQGWDGEPQPWPEKPRVMGAFSVDEGQATLLPPRNHIRAGSWTEQGYPYYSGTASYRQTVYIPEFARGQRVILRAIDPTDVIEFVVNGAIAGLRPWAPYEADITPLVTPGPNVIELRVTNSTANLLLSDPRPSGLIHGAVAFLA